MVYDPVKKREYYVKNKEKSNEYGAKRREELKQHAIDSITSREILDHTKWDMWCNEIKRTNDKHPYSEDFTNDVIFDMLIKGCFYCGGFATTIDRLDSTVSHNIDNCIGCCSGCNISKGVTDPATFIRKAYYRARGKYVDDIVNLWFKYKNKPKMYDYKRRSKKKGICFELDKKVFDTVIDGDCAYCKRAPTTWFGIDRVVPSLGYVLENVVTCCFDCNLDKHEDDVGAVIKRNERIAKRVDIGELSIEDCEKVILHCGAHKTSKEVYARGKVYASKIEASRALGKSDTYVCECIKYGRHSNDIFEISDIKYL